MKTTLGLIGYPLGHSFSKRYFSMKFKQENCKNIEYLNFELPDIDIFPAFLKRYPNLVGLNVTIPYKREILKFVNYKSEVVRQIRAANTLTILPGRRIIADNTDVIGFERSILPHLKNHHQRALILGTGGAAQAVAYVFKKLGISYLFVSRNPQNKHQLSYEDLHSGIFRYFKIVVNTTPVGSYPHVDHIVQFPYDLITDLHLFYDLIYNPSKTRFLQEAEKKGATILNGLEMLQLQAEASWEIWTKKSGVKFKKNC